MPVLPRTGKKLVEAALSGDVDEMAEVLVPLLKGYVSVRDAAAKSPAENYYHGFLSSLFACAGLPSGNFVSNGEAGDVLPILFSPRASVRGVSVS